MSKLISRRTTLLAAAAAAALAAGASTLAQAASPKPLVEVWKDPNCGCCHLWVEHLQAEGFEVKVNDVGNTAARKRLGMPEALGSCHTARVGGYVIEGHVPAADIRRLLKDKPQGLGLSVPGMPIGSPGMDGPEYKGRKDPYAVLLVQRDGSTRTFTRYAGDRPMARQQEALRRVSDAAPLAWSEGEIRRIDKASRKISLRHGEIKNLDMPPMTMVFQVRDVALLEGLQAGQKVRFTAVQENGAYWVTRIEPAAL